MSSKVRRIGVLTSGGDAPGMNAAIRAVVMSALHFGVECVGIRRGFHGLIHGDMVPMREEDVSGLMGRGGTVLYTARSREFMTKKGQKSAYEACAFQRLDGLVAIGGDGTFAGALELSRLGMPVIGIPATIDNDIACTGYTIGFDTACNTAIESIDRLNDTMQSHERCSVVEVMGRRAGYLALNVAMASGAAAILIPEKEPDIERDVIERIRISRLKGRDHFTVIVAEGTAGVNGIAERIKLSTGIDTRVTVLGHVQRGGAPLARDRIAASRMGCSAVSLLAEGKINRVVAMNGDELTDHDISEALKMKKSPDKNVFRILNAIMCES